MDGSAKWTKEEVSALAKACYADPILFAHTLIPSVFVKEIPWHHRGMLAILLQRTEFLIGYEKLDKIIDHFVYRERPDDSASPVLPMFIKEDDGSVTLVTNPYTLMMLPRGTGKTTMINLALVIAICYKEHEVITLISESSRHAQLQLSWIRATFERNERIRLVFGDLVPTRSSIDKWSESMADFTNGVTIVALGRGGQVRGMLKERRPTLIIIDDVENEESVQTEEQREKARIWFMRAVFPAIERVNAQGRIVIAGTLLHRSALLLVLQKDPVWNSIVLEDVDKDGEMLWLDNRDEAELARIKESFRIVGDLEGFYMEHYNQIRVEELAKFSNSMFQHRIYPLDQYVSRCLTMDPAISKKRRASQCAFAVVGITQYGETDVLDVYGKQGMAVREQIDKFFELSMRWECIQHGIEAVAYQAVLLELMKYEMPKKNHFFSITPITHSSEEGKNMRIAGMLQPRYAAGMMWHRRRFGEYENALLDWPHCAMDIADAVAMAVAELSGHGALAAGPENDLTIDTMPPLASVIGGDFRMAP